MFFQVVKGYYGQLLVELSKIEINAIKDYIADIKNLISDPEFQGNIELLSKTEQDLINEAIDTLINQSN